MRKTRVRVEKMDGEMTTIKSLPDETNKEAAAGLVAAALEWADHCLTVFGWPDENAESVAQAQAAVQSQQEGA